jgi:hypothetical protein
MCDEESEKHKEPKKSKEPETFHGEFYTVDNIIGYTGDLNKSPTVYFRSGTQFGRITQMHTNEKNIGRSKVRSADDYKMTSGVDGKMQEFYGGRVHHRSREKFTKVDRAERETLAILAQAISGFGAKEKYKKK